ncbi:MAG: Holliday junction resolvase RuvX [Armatimonadetes bacterium]|nr:Holliday junction resolvase RuvX [Armatimonadota bacterium]
MKILAIDFGFKRIGFAVGESASAISTVPAIPAKGALKKDADAINLIAKNYQVSELALGVPLGHSDDRQARICRTLGEHLRTLGWVVHEVDESLSSVEAQSRFSQFELTAAQRRKTIDSRAAGIILERFFDASN